MILENFLIVSGTALAGFVAAVVLALDLYNRNKAALVVLAEADKKGIRLVVQNVGKVPLCIQSLTTVPDWESLNAQNHIDQLALIPGYTLMPDRYLTLAMTPWMVESLLKSFYNNSENRHTPYFVQAEVSYKRLNNLKKDKTWLDKIRIKISDKTFSKPKHELFQINLSGVFLSAFPVTDIIPDAQAKKHIDALLGSLNELK